MSTSALSAPHLDLSVSDTMDLHSDSGLDFGDGGVDIDVHSPGGLDDDVSFHDAATDADPDVQTTTGDHDDFMADNDDLIEEDAADEDAEVNIDLHSTEYTAREQPVEATEEDELVGYSDDEDEPSHNTPAVTDARENETPGSTASGRDIKDTLLVKDSSGSSDRDGEDEQLSHRVASPHGSPADSGAVQEQDPYTAQKSSEEIASQEQSQSQTDANSDPQPASDNSPTHLESKISASEIELSTAIGVDNSLTEQSGQTLQDLNGHPITINYDGNELWLFKDHDYEDSGDYLLEDISVLNKPVKSVLDACRETLGGDVTEDLELGFRLDSLHNIELYDQHMPCAFHQFGDIVRVYLQLHAQDGITDPESFYITLVSRPRISSLLSEMDKAVTEGIGHSGLSKAITEGKTAFTAHYLHNSTEQVYGDWEDGDEQEQSTAQDNVQPVEQHDCTEEYHDEEGENFEDHEYADEQQQDESNDQAVENLLDNSEEKATGPITMDNENATEGVALSGNEQEGQFISHAAVSNEEPQEDLLDYSDEEDEGDEPGSQNQASHHSSASATVQGDDPPQVQDNFDNISQYEQQDGQGDGTEEAAYDGPTDLDGETFAQYEGHDAFYGQFEGEFYGQAFGGEYEQEYDQSQELEGYPAYDVEDPNNETTNYTGDFGQHPPGYDNYLDLTVGSNVGEPGAVDALKEANGPLDFDDSAVAAKPLEDDPSEEDEIDFSDDEDVAASQAPVAAFAAADTVATSSSGLQNMSPQGQKRTFDEVGNDVAYATTSTDAKRLRV